MIEISPSIVKYIMRCPQPVADKWSPALEAAAQAWGIDSDEERAMWLAQIGHETGGLKWLREIWGPTSAQKRYEGRRDLGNTQPGDGYRFRGRGPFMHTGRTNYIKATFRIRKLIPNSPDFVVHPELFELPGWGSMAAGEFWDRHSGMERSSEIKDIVGNTRILNGGLNGLADRRKYYSRAKVAFEL